MKKPPMHLPSISRFVLERTNNLLLRTMALVILLAVVVAIAAMALHYVGLVNSTIAAYRSNIAQALVYGDRFQSTQQAESLAQGGGFSSAWIVSQDFKVVVGKGGANPLGFDNLRSDLLSKDWVSTWATGAWEIVSKHPIVDSQRTVLGYLVLSFPLPLCQLLLQFLLL